MSKTEKSKYWLKFRNPETGVYWFRGIENRHYPEFVDMFDAEEIWCLRGTGETICLKHRTKQTPFRDDGFTADGYFRLNCYGGTAAIPPKQHVTGGEPGFVVPYYPKRFADTGVPIATHPAPARGRHFHKFVKVPKPAEFIALDIVLANEAKMAAGIRLEPKMSDEQRARYLGFVLADGSPDLLALRIFEGNER